VAAGGVRGFAGRLVLDRCMRHDLPDGDTAFDDFNESMVIII
jgi:hypothetical protein